MRPVNSVYNEMQAKLVKIYPPAEIFLKSELIQEIQILKEQKNALILGHNYMEPALYHFASDVRGDSLELARQAAETKEDRIVFCGVRFMAETAKILNPTKTVLLPSEEAGCYLAASITAKDIRELKRRFPGVPVVTYINTYAEAKAESTICCTSGNASAVVKSLKSDTVIFLPDEFLAQNVARETGKHIIFPSLKETHGETSLDYQMIGWRGRCEVHEKFTVEDTENIRRQFPDLAVLAHPECSPEVVRISDFSGSTSAMIRYIQETNKPRYLLLTECSMGDNIIAENPEKEMLRLCNVRCPHMNTITLEQTRDALKFDRYKIEIPEAIRSRAYEALHKMLLVH